MGIKIIKTSERAPYREKYYKLIDENFKAEGFSTDPDSYKIWRDSPFLHVSMGLDDAGEIQSYVSMVKTTEKDAKELIAGKIKEAELPPYEPGSYETAYLYWITLILKNRRHGPHLVKNIFREVEINCRNWYINITHVYAIAFSKVAEKLMKRYFFTQAGLYQGKYPIMISKVSENPYLRAFLPQL